MLPEEVELGAALPEVPPRLWPVLVFSMKEAAFKAYFAVTPQLLGFEDMCVRSLERGQFLVETRGGATLALPIQGRAAWNMERVYSAAWIGTSTALHLEPGAKSHRVNEAPVSMAADSK
jgi:4'-phosphopantetheinyl transferase EntD